MKTTVIYHSADFDGIFCREIAKHFMPDAELIGWNFGDAPVKLPAPHEESFQLYILDLPVDKPLGLEKASGFSVFNIAPNIVWIDHHKSSIESHDSTIPGYRIDGVAACRLAWQWFTHSKNEIEAVLELPTKEDFVNRNVDEPLAVRLAGEYDIWDKRDPDAELFQHGLRSLELTDSIWRGLLSCNQSLQTAWVGKLLLNGMALQYAKTQENAAIIKRQGFDLEWEGLKFLACNHAMFNSHLFTAGIRDYHDALFGFRYDGKEFHVSLYHATGKEHHDLSLIAVKHGGGGHRGACGFRIAKLPFLL